MCAQSLRPHPSMGILPSHRFLFQIQFLTNERHGWNDTKKRVKRLKEHPVSLNHPDTHPSVERKRVKNQIDRYSPS